MALFWAREGDRVTVRPGVYRENLMVEKAVILSGDGPASTIIDGGGIVDVVTLSADQVTVSGFHIRNSSSSPGYAGILVDSNGNRIEDVVCGHNRNGIYLRESSGNLITGVVCENNTLHGMTFGASGSDGNEIRDSIFRYNGHDGLNGNGIHMQGARGSILQTSVFTENRYLGLYVNECSDIVLYTSTFSGNRYGLNLRGSERITVGWCDVADHDGYGIALVNSVFCQILGGSMTRNVAGVWIEGDVRDIRIHQNTIRDNRENGVSATAASAGADARWNWWGSDTGPFHPVLNSGGTGDRVSEHVVFDPWLNTAGRVIPPPSPPRDGDDGESMLVLGFLLVLLILVVLMIAILGFAVARKDRHLRGPIPTGSRWYGRSMAEGGGRSDTREAGSHTGGVLPGRRTDGAGPGDTRGRGRGDVRDPKEVRVPLGILGSHLRVIGRRLATGGTRRGNPRGIPPWRILWLKRLRREFIFRRERDSPAKPKPQRVGRDTGMGKKDVRPAWKGGRPGSGGRMDHPYRDAIQSEMKRK